jgi:hypothetical protein
MARTNFKYQDTLIENLSINESAYFFKKKSEQQINDKTIKNLFLSACPEDKEYKRLTEVVRHNMNISDKEVFYSLLIIQYFTPPSFINNCPKELFEIKSAYLMLVEIEDYIVILKKNISGLNKFVNSLQTIKGNVLSSVLVDKSTAFEQIRLTNMSLNDNSLRNKSYEANDLQSTMPLFGTNHYIVKDSRFNTNDEVCTLCIGSSRIAKFGNKKNIGDVCSWINKIVTKIDNCIEKETFFSNFAYPIKWSDFKAELKPCSILINVQELKTFLSQRNIQNIYLKQKDNEIDVTDFFYRLINNLSNSLELKELDDGVFQAIGTLGSLSLFKNNKSITLRAKGWLNSIYIHTTDGGNTKLITLINNIQSFIVSFEQCEYTYYGRRLYRDDKLLGNIDSLLSVFEPKSELIDTTSEKGSLTGDKESFDNNSIFSFVEKEYSDSISLVCDDLGNEWADHISVQENRISFIHSKHKKKGLSATNFQDVISQALKNIGNMNPGKEQLEAKIPSFSKCYSGSQIAKNRKGTIEDFIENFIAINKNPNTIKEVCLAIDFVSFNELQSALSNLKNNISFKQRNSTVQLLWLINSFISSCKDAGLHCRIFCQP